MKALFIALSSFLIGALITGYIGFNIAVMPSYAGQYSMALDYYSDLEQGKQEDALISLKKVYVPNQSCFIHQLVASPWVINKENYQASLQSGFTHIGIEKNQIESFCDDLNELN